jgi:DNA-binding NarL/FixJ family response regulator
MRADGLDVCVATTDSRELVVESWHVDVDAVVCFLPNARTQVAAVLHLHGRLPGAHIVVVGPLSSRLRLRRLLYAGADAFVLDSQMDVALATAVHAACIGQVSLPREFMGSVERPPLTYRQKEILRRVVQGKGNAEIAQELYLAESTVKGHLSQAFARLGVRSRAEAAALVLDPDAGRGLGIMEICR